MGRSGGRNVGAGVQLCAHRGHQFSRKWFGKIEQCLCGGRGSIIDHIWRFEEFSGGVEESDQSGPSVCMLRGRKCTNFVGDRSRTPDLEKGRRIDESTRRDVVYLAAIERVRHLSGCRR